MIFLKKKNLKDIFWLVSGFWFSIEGVCRPPGKREPLLDSGQRTGQWTPAIRRKCRTFVEFFHARWWRIFIQSIQLWRLWLDDICVEWYNMLFDISAGVILQRWNKYYTGGSFSWVINAVKVFQLGQLLPSRNAAGNNSNGVFTKLIIDRRSGQKWSPVNAFGLNLGYRQIGHKHLKMLQNMICDEREESDYPCEARSEWTLRERGTNHGLEGQGCNNSKKRCSAAP